MHVPCRALKRKEKKKTTIQNILDLLASYQIAHFVTYFWSIENHCANPVYPWIYTEIHFQTRHPLNRFISSPSLFYFYHFKSLNYMVFLYHIVTLYFVNLVEIIWQRPICVSYSVVSNSETLWTVACQAPLSMEISRQESWNDCHVLFQGIFLTQWLNPRLLLCR